MMRLGKLSNDDLKRLVFNKITEKRSEVIVRPGVGEDCAVIDLIGDVCVISTDPITAASNDIGSLSVHVSCNDVASSGAEPVAMLVTILIPPHAAESEVEKVIGDMTKTADSLNVDIVGGHTEITDAVSRIIVSSVVIGKASAQGVVKSSGAKIGDALIMTQYAATEGTAIIANDFESSLKGLLSREEIEEAKSLSASFSVVKEGLIAAKYGVSAMHDVTEGGIYGAVHELCTASSCGAWIEQEKIPVLMVTKKICESLQLNPYRLISSGSMLIAVSNPGGLLKLFYEAGIQAAVIGKITQKDILSFAGDFTQTIEPPLSDEIYRLSR